MKSLKWAARGIVYASIGLPAMVVLAVGGLCVGVALLVIFTVMDIVNRINGYSA